MNYRLLKSLVWGKVIYRSYKYIFNFFDLLTPTNNNQWLVYFTESHYSDNCKYYFEFLRSTRQDISAFLLVKDKQLFEEIGEQENVYYHYSLKGFYLFLTSKTIVISNGSVFFYFLPYVLDVKRKVIANLWHGIPLKNLCMKIDKFRLEGKSVFLQQNSLLFASSSREQGFFSDCFLLEKEKIKVTGTPRNDFFFKNKNLTTQITDVLYAPTWREEGKGTVFFPFTNFDFDDFICFCEEYKIRFFMRAHRYDMASLELFLESTKVSKVRYQKWIIFAGQEDYPDVQELLLGMSALVTDYSSIYLDYLLLNRPIIFLPYDLKEYESYRGFLMDYDKNTPGEKVLDYGRFKTALKGITLREEFFECARSTLKNQFHLWQDGESCSRITTEISKLSNPA